MASTLVLTRPLPIFCLVGRQKTRDSFSTALRSEVTAVVGGSEPPSSSQSLSPGKRLEKLKTFEQAGVLTTIEFNEQKAFALRNIRELNK